MNKHLFALALLSICLSTRIHAQANGLRQYFDGADTAAQTALKVDIDTAAGNIWQIGKPSKSLFNAASTIPNAIVTDTLNNYPMNNSSRFSIKFKDSAVGFFPIIAVRWTQKLDCLKGHSGGIVEFSKNGGPWENALNNPNVYNFYGYMQSSKDTLPNGTYTFSGQDSIWRDIWFCLRRTSATDSFSIRYTLFTDTSMDVREGWMIDNMLVQRTFVHTVGLIESPHPAKVYPNHTSGPLFIEATHASTQNLIGSVIVLDVSGKILLQYTEKKSRYMIDLSPYPPGQYFVKITANSGNETFKVIRD